MASFGYTLIRDNLHYNNNNNSNDCAATRVREAGLDAQRASAHDFRGASPRGPHRSGSTGERSLFRQLTIVVSLGGEPPLYTRLRAPGKSPVLERAHTRGEARVRAGTRPRVSP